MKRIVLFLCCFFLFTAFSSDKKQEPFNFLGTWTVSDGNGSWKEFIFYEGHYVKLVPKVKTPNHIDKNYSYSVNWDNDPFVLTIELYKSDEGDTVGDNKLPFALKIIDENHIQMALDRGPITKASFTKSDTMTLTRE